MIDKITHLETEDKKYPMAFTLNVMEAIQEKYGTLDKWSKLIQNDQEPDIKALKFFMTEAINEGIEIQNKKTGEKTKPITSKQAGRILTEVGISKALNKVTNTVVESVKTGEESPKNEITMQGQKI